MPMTTRFRTRLLTFAVCLPLALASCDSSGSSKGASVTPSVSGSATPGTRPTGFPIATVYEVTAKPGVSDKDLQNAIPRLAKLKGVVGVAVHGKHRLRVELSAIAISQNAPAVYHALERLGSVKAV